MSHAQLEQLTSLGTFLSGLGTLFIALLAGAILVYDVRLRRRQLRETLSRSYSTLNVDLQISLRPNLGSPTAMPWCVLESRITIKNAGSEIRAIPAAYVHARAVPGSSEAGQAFSERDFSQLEPVGRLSEPLNTARFHSAVWHVGPDEIDTVVRWDLLSEEFIMQHPILIVRAEVFSVSSEFVGATYSSDNIAGVDRGQWMQFMEDDGGARHKQVIFSQAAKDVEGIKEGSWVFLELGGAGIDVEASKRFRKVLGNLCYTGCQRLVVLKPTTSLGGSNWAVGRDGCEKKAPNPGPQADARGAA